MISNTQSSININFVLAPSVNFALQQNHVPVIRELSIQNTGETDIDNINITITAEPDFALSYNQHIDVLKSGETRAFESIKISLSSKFLAELTERLTGRFILDLSIANKPYTRIVKEIDILAYDQWNGTNILPEMLSAFITPNHPEIPRIIRSAAAILERWTGNPSFDEYQSRNPDRVKKQMAAIFEAIADMQLIYCSVPASFEESGQRIRLSDTIFSQRLANCFDLSLLYAACLEAVGIHPLVIIIKGHAFAGAWLIDESFADPVNDDPSLISKRIAEGINDIAVVEATAMNAGNRTGFDLATKAAEHKLTDIANFYLFIDVKRARFGGIRPLPLRVATPNGWEIREEAASTSSSYSPDELVTDAKLLQVNQVDISKQRLWERKLLDLTLRNNLLNIRVTKSVIQFITINLSRLEDALADGKEFQVLAKPADWENNLLDAGIYQSINSTDPIADLVTNELSHQRLRTYLSEMDLAAGLTNLYRASRLSIEENGANTLFIGLGLLKWYETEASEKPRYAPILLIPVEIIRKSAQKGYIIRTREEETTINITLLEMIRQDFDITIGLENLPKDESGVDVKKIFNILRQTVMAKSRWDVEEQAILGTFSFSKFILWNDIHNNAQQLAQNNVVSSLISGRLEIPVSEIDAAAVSDINLRPETLALPISTDSSQLEAILSSGKGKSFVLHGPPGTGKSQTITNVIANALYAGKKVLFVASKKAALEVVESRLQAIGIGEFCLELHSNKSKKSAVLEQLKRATLVTRKAAPENFQATADRLYNVRAELNTYVDALHHKHSSGYSLFECFTGYMQLSDVSGEVYLPESLVEHLNAYKTTQWNDLAEELQAIAMIVSSPATHPLKEFKTDNYTPQIKTDGKLLLEKLLQSLGKFEQVAAQAAAVFKLDGLIKTKEQVTIIAALAKLIQSLPDSPATFISTDALEQTLAQVIGIAEHGKQRDVLRAGILGNFSKDILTYPAERTLIDWNIASEKWFLPRWFKQRAIAKNISSYSLKGSVEHDGIPALMEQIKAYQHEQSTIDSATFMPGLCSFLWKNGDCDWANIIETSNVYILVNRYVGQIVGLAGLKNWKLQFAEAIAEGSRAYFSQYQKQLDSFLTIHQQVKQYQSELQTLLKINFSVAESKAGSWISNLTGQCQTWLSNLDSLKDWFNYYQARQLNINADLRPLVEAYENNAILNQSLVLSYKKGLYKAIAQHIISKNPQLATFDGQLFEGKIKRFQEISKAFEQLTRDELYARLAARIPAFTQEATQSSEIGILQKNIRNNGRGTSIRNLFDGIPNLLPRLTPCMLMSPISVAQYFDAGSPKFDLVVFDEASQMPTCEAVGAIARGNSVIVVGDPKQMPPTSFFSANNVDEDNIDKEDLESILDDCLALSMPSHHLLWHYRSKHESLIAFSNARFYDNNLLTFPSTDDIASKVTFERVSGYYDKGKSRQNRFEAKAIVDEIVHRLSNTELSKKSIGVVTFSSVQQTLIEDMLTDIFSLRPDLEKLALESEEPIFIKNLENVQGDERDVILFSIGYGPDEQGKVSLNFGPINREGGWRRLNVAVSRARYEMKVFSTLTADQIDLNRTGSEGVAGLKAFLAYAEKGKQALPLRANNSVQTVAGFEDLLANEIRKHGYQAHTHIGCSAYKIDIGVVDPKNPSRYLLAILSDGKTYHDAKTSSDREIVQIGVLKLLGWNIHKVWATEWWEKPDKVLAGILAAIHNAEQGIPAVSHSIINDNFLNSIISAPKAPALVEMPEPIILPKIPNKQFYEVAIMDRPFATSTDDFFIPSNRAVVKVQIRRVLEAESPITKNLLSKRIITSWGMTRMGSRLATHFEALFAELNITQTTGTGSTIFWKHNHDPNSYPHFRVPQSEAGKRDADDLPVIEVANAIKYLLTNQISLTKADLVKETAKLFGFARAGANVETAVLKGIETAILLNYAKIEYDRVVLVG